MTLSPMNPLPKSSSSVLVDSYPLLLTESFYLHLNDLIAHLSARLFSSVVSSFSQISAYQEAPASSPETETETDVTKGCCCTRGPGSSPREDYSRRLGSH